MSTEHVNYTFDPVLAIDGYMEHGLEPVREAHTLIRFLAESEYDTEKFLTTASTLDMVLMRRVQSEYMREHLIWSLRSVNLMDVKCAIEVAVEMYEENAR